MPSAWVPGLSFFGAGIGAVNENITIKNGAWAFPKRHFFYRLM